jgi:hypothetical protein
MLVRALLVPIAIVLLAGCGGADDESVPTTPTTDGPVLEGASTDPVVRAGGSAATSLLTAVRVAEHPGYDRIAFEFANGVPGYDVRYVDRPVLADGSGDEIAVAGAAVLLVRMEPALDADLTQESAPPTYTGPMRFSPDTGVVAELVRTGGFEAVLTWAVGTNAARPFLVTRLDDPARLVIDVADAP